MQNPHITLLGLGPGDADLLTRQAWQILSAADEVILRTHRHPVVAGLPAGVQVRSFDALFETGAPSAEVYAQIVEQVLELGRRPQGVIYAVPGHPFIGEATAPEIARRAAQEGLSVHVAAGVSFLEPVFSALQGDPFPHTTLVDALELTRAHMPPFPPSAPALIAQVDSPEIAAKVKMVLAAVYPEQHRVKLFHAAGRPGQQVEELELRAIDRSTEIGRLTALYVPALDPASSFEAFQAIIAHLRAPDGCPWDQEQTHQSLRQSLLEETYEVVAALDADDPAAMQEEFGDLLLQIVLHAQIGAEYGEFTMADVLRGIHHKIVRRHPHVFGDLSLADTQGVLQNWERLKSEERLSNGKAETSLLDSIALALPALLQAEAYQSRAARVGFDWPAVGGVFDKVQEEFSEVQAAATPAEQTAEIGDLFFAVVNLARWLKVEPESALREANLRFKSRFAFIEAAARRQGRSISDLSVAEMEELWEMAKRE